ncbi:MAG: DUF3899 domain-containing protein [Clostridia bacterium]|jgi:hypothetical protein|nr:DUF3899 domain-containing protein [Clostridia bacterium]
MKRVLPYLITTLVGAAIVVTIILAQRIWTAEDMTEIMRRLSDAFFVAGVCIGGVGLLVFASNGGVFYMLTFGIIRLFDLFRRNINERKYKDFYEYKESKKDKKHGFGFMLVVGLVFIAIAGAFLAAYYNV